MSEHNQEKSKSRKADRKPGWKPIQATLEVRYQIIKRKSQAGVEYTTYKPVILPKR